MRVVRTVGQAFEVCHKIAQDQMPDKLIEEVEISSNLRTKDGIGFYFFINFYFFIALEEDSAEMASGSGPVSGSIQPVELTEPEACEEERASNSSSPAQPPPVGSQQIKRHSIVGF